MVWSAGETSCSSSCNSGARRATGSFVAAAEGVAVSGHETAGRLWYIAEIVKQIEMTEEHYAAL
jgi:hypothetical protein